jgi:hypothetical protein
VRHAANPAAASLACASAAAFRATGVQFEYTHMSYVVPDDCNLDGTRRRPRPAQLPPTVMAAPLGVRARGEEEEEEGGEEEEGEDGDFSGTFADELDAAQLREICDAIADSVDDDDDFPVGLAPLAPVRAGVDSEEGAGAGDEAPLLSRRAQRLSNGGPGRARKAVVECTVQDHSKEADVVETMLLFGELLCDEGVGAAIAKMDAEKPSVGLKQCFDNLKGDCLTQLVENVCDMLRGPDVEEQDELFHDVDMLLASEIFGEMHLFVCKLADATLSDPYVVTQEDGTEARVQDIVYDRVALACDAAPLTWFVRLLFGHADERRMVACDRAGVDICSAWVHMANAANAAAASHELLACVERLRTVWTLQANAPDGSQDDAISRRRLVEALRRVACTLCLSVWSGDKMQATAAFVTMYDCAEKGVGKCEWLKKEFYRAAADGSQEGHMLLPDYLVRSSDLHCGIAPALAGALLIAETVPTGAEVAGTNAPDERAALRDELVAAATKRTPDNPDVRAEWIPKKKADESCLFLAHQIMLKALRPTFNSGNVMSMAAKMTEAPLLAPSERGLTGGQLDDPSPVRLGDYMADFLQACVSAAGVGPLALIEMAATNALCAAVETLLRPSETEVLRRKVVIERTWPLMADHVEKSLRAIPRAWHMENIFPFSTGKTLEAIKKEYGGSDKAKVVYRASTPLRDSWATSQEKETSPNFDHSKLQQVPCAAAGRCTLKLHVGNWRKDGSVPENIEGVSADFFPTIDEVARHAQRLWLLGARSAEQRLLKAFGDEMKEFGTHEILTRLFKAQVSLPNALVCNRYHVLPALMHVLACVPNASGRQCQVLLEEVRDVHKPGKHSMYNDVLLRLVGGVHAVHMHCHLSACVVKTVCDVLAEEDKADVTSAELHLMVGNIANFLVEQAKAKCARADEHFRHEDLITICDLRCALERLFPPCFNIIKTCCLLFGQGSKGVGEYDIMRASEENYRCNLLETFVHDAHAAFFEDDAYKTVLETLETAKEERLERMSKTFRGEKGWKRDNDGDDARTVPDTFFLFEEHRRIQISEDRFDAYRRGNGKTRANDIAAIKKRKETQAAPSAAGRGGGSKAPAKRARR